MDSEREQVIKLIHRWIELGWQRGNTAALNECFSDNFVDHDPAGRSQDIEGFNEGVRKLYSAFPDFYASVKDIIWDMANKKAVVRWTAKGTHSGIYAGYSATNKIINFKGIEILCILNNRITERWGEWDGTDIFNQIKK